MKLNAVEKSGSRFLHISLRFYSPADQAEFLFHRRVTSLSDIKPQIWNILKYRDDE